MLARASAHLFVDRSWPGTAPTLLASLSLTHASSSLCRQANSRIVDTREPALGAEACATDRLERVSRAVEQHASGSPEAAHFEKSGRDIAQ